MILLTDLDFSLPLKNPVIIFSLVLFIILFAPILFKKIKVPHIIGLILAGVIVGPYGTNLLSRDSSIVLFRHSWAFIYYVSCGNRNRP